MLINISASLLISSKQSKSAAIAINISISYKGAPMAICYAKLKQRAPPAILSSALAAAAAIRGGSNSAAIAHPI
jgi:hypothetical protein